MTGVCVVKFDSHSANEICFVPKSCLQSSKNVKIKTNGDYLFVHKNDRQHRARGKLLFTGPLNECEEYCRADDTLLIDDASWFTGAAQIKDILKDTQNEDKIFVLLEDLIDYPNKRLETCLQVKFDNNHTSIVPNVYIRIRSDSLLLRSPAALLRKTRISNP